MCSKKWNWNFFDFNGSLYCVDFFPVAVSCGAELHTQLVEIFLEEYFLIHFLKGLSELKTCFSIREHSYMTSDVFWVFLTYLP